MHKENKKYTDLDKHKHHTAISRQYYWLIEFLEMFFPANLLA